MGTEVVVVNDVEFPVVEYQGQRIVTFTQVAEVHNVSRKTIESAYHGNKKHFVEGVDTYLIDFSKNLEIQGFEIPPRGLRVFYRDGLSNVGENSDGRPSLGRTASVGGYIFPCEIFASATASCRRTI